MQAAISLTPVGQTLFQPSRNTLNLPELLEIQRASFQKFLQHGIPDLFSQLAPIRVEKNNILVELSINADRFQLVAGEETPRDCILKMKTYSCKLYVEAQILYTTVSGELLQQIEREWVLVAHLPMMTKRGHFIVNGSPRVIVHQVVRSPGIYFQQVLERDDDKRYRFYGDIIPRRGVWLRLQTTKKGKIEAKLKKGKKVGADMLQRCFQLIERLEKETCSNSTHLPPLWYKNNQRRWEGSKNKVLVPLHVRGPLRGHVRDPAGVEVCTKKKGEIAVSYARFSYGDSSFSRSSDLPLSPTEVETPPLFESIQVPINYNQKVQGLDVEGTERICLASALEERSLLYTYDKLYRPAEDKDREKTSKRGKNLSFQKNSFPDKRFRLKRCYKNLFFTFKDASRYDLSDLGREKINTKFGMSLVESQLTAQDIHKASDWLYKLIKGQKSVDDIDHFQNRRIRTSGELLHTQFENGIDRLKRLVFNKLKEFVNTNSVTKTTFQPNQKSQISLHQTPFKMNGTSLFAFSQRESLSIRNRTNMYPIKDSDVRNNKPELISWDAVSSIDKVKTNSFFSRNRFFHKKQAISLKTPDVSPYAPTPAGSRTWSPAGSRTWSRVTGSVAGRSRQTTAEIKRDTLPSTEVYPLRGLRGSPQGGSREVEKADLILASFKELFSTKPINGALRELFGSNPLSQYMDQTNPLAEMTHKRRMSSLGAGGVSRESAGMAIRGIHPTHYGRICPIETPEGKNAGLVNSLAFYAKINDRGFVETPYYKVIKRQVQPELGWSFFSAKQESASQLKIAPSDLQRSSNNVLTWDHVPVRVADNFLDLFKKVDSDQVECITVSPVQMISVATSLIPFLEHNDANRALMGSNMQRQAVPLMIPERPIVGTGLESLVVAESGHLVQSESTGFVSYVSANLIVIEYLSQETQRIFPHVPSFSMKSSSVEVRRMDNRHERESAWTGTTISSIAKDCERTSKKEKFSLKTTHKNDRQHVLPPTKVHVLHTNTHVLHTRECVNTRSRVYDHVRGSSTCVSEAPFSQLLSLLDNKGHVQNSTHKTSMLADFSKISSSRHSFQSIWLQKNHVQGTRTLIPFTHHIDSFDRSNQDTCLTQRALAKEGDWVQKGDILTDCSASDQGELAVGKNILVAYIPWEGYNFEDAIVISERLVKEHVYTSLHIERYDCAAQDVKEGSEWFTNDLPGISSESITHLNESGLPKIGSLVKEGDILVGKMRYSNKKPTTPYEKLLCDILGENNFSARDSSLYVPKGVHARVIKYKVITFFEDSSTRTSPRRDTSYGGSRTWSVGSCQIRSPKLVHIFLGEKRPIQVGDKMSGRHGNKGVVAKILPRQDMPYLADGTPIDMILNPLGVPSRMNVGQVFESLLGLAGTYLAQNFQIIAFDELYGVEASQSLVYLKLYQARLQSGQTWLFQVDFPGKSRVIDGRSGQCFDQWITVGRAYMLKLIHMVHEKIHARATGPYALITQQPLRGRSQKGGQRLGEMEVWALEGFGAAYTLQELLTKKSDDMLGRKQVASAILPQPIKVVEMLQPFNKTQDNRPTLGQPEIFKVLICELQALCLDVGVYSLTTQSFQRSFLSRIN